MTVPTVFPLRMFTALFLGVILLLVAARFLRAVCPVLWKRVWWEQFNLCETGLSSLPDMSRCTEDCPVCNSNKCRFRQIFTSNGAVDWFLLKDIFTLPGQIVIIWELRLNRYLRKALRVEESLHLEKEKVTKVENIVCLNTCVWISEYMLRFWYVIWAVSTMSLGVRVQTWTWPMATMYKKAKKSLPHVRPKSQGIFEEWTALRELRPRFQEWSGVEWDKKPWCETWVTRQERRFCTWPRGRRSRLGWGCTPWTSLGRCNCCIRQQSSANTFTEFYRFSVHFAG